MDEELISVEKLIDNAKRLGIEFGKGDPYNRLRYYTKIGWLPHMQRKLGESDESSIAKGHYPKWVLKRLIQIENLKKKELTNEQITKKLEISNKVQAVTEFIKAPQSRLKIATYASLILLLLIFANELDIIKLGRSKSSFSLEAIPDQMVQIVDSGETLFPAFQQKVFVNTTNIKPDSKVNITFKQDYSPATRYWVSEIISQQGFEVSFDSPLSKDAYFDWLLTN